MDDAFQHAKILYLSGMLFDCLTACEALLQSNPDSADTLNLTGMLCYRGGDTKAAIPFFERAVAVDPGHSEALGNLALCYKGAGRLDEALAIYDRALALDPADAQVQYNRAIALRATGDLHGAALGLKRASELAPLLADVFIVLGNVRLELGDTDLAVLAYRDALAAHPEQFAPYAHLARALRLSGQPREAVSLLTLAATMHGIPQAGRPLAEAQEQAGDLAAAAATLTAYLAVKTDDAEAWECLGDLRFAQGSFKDAEAAFQRSVALDPLRARAHMRLHAVAQILGRPDEARQHQARALGITRCFTEIGHRPDRPTVLVLKAEGDWQINTPTDFLIQAKDWGKVHYYYIDTARPVHPGLPDCDIIFNAIAEPDRAQTELRAAAQVVAYLGKPCLNDPLCMAEARRDRVSRLLAGLPHSIVPQVRRVTTREQRADLGEADLPLLLRPAGTHAGEGMVLARTRADLDQALVGLGDGDIYVIPFIDYAGADGQYRKYRVVVVDGEPLPFHLGLSVDWMVHYANAKPLAQVQMNREEEHFLADFNAVFGPDLRADLRSMAEIIGLDFFAVDCGIHADGRLVLFEVDAGAIIHLLDDPALFAYKHRHVPRIFEALNRRMTAMAGAVHE